MRKTLSIIIALLLATSLGMSGCGLSSTLALKLLVVHSYHEAWAWDQDIQRGIIEGLSRRGYIQDQDYELKTFYMDTKITYTTTEQMKERAEIALDLIDEYEPDMVFTNDDDALRHVAVEYAKRNPQKHLPFVFCGVNGDPLAYSPIIVSLAAPGGPITGALERFPFHEALSLAKRLNPSATRIVLLADASPSSTFVVNSFQQEYLDVVTNSPLEVIGLFQVQTFQEWQAKAAGYQTEADFLGFITYHQLRDENGQRVPAPEVVDWTVHHSHLPEIGFLTFHAEDGFLAAAGVSGYDTGIYVGVMGGEILGGRDPGTIPIVDPQVTDIVFNLERANMLAMTIPAAELAKAARVFQHIGQGRY